MTEPGTQGQPLQDPPEPPRTLASGLRERLLIALGLAIFCAAGFFGLAHVNAARAAAGAVYIDLETALDRAIPFDPRWVWIYLSYFPGCFLPILSWNRLPLFRQVAVGYAVEFGTCFLFFVLIPARMAQPFVLGDTSHAWAVRKIFEADPGFNIFPSLHVANAFFVAAVAIRIWRPLGIATYIWACLIAVSTLTVKQHYFVDVVAGAALAALTIHLVLRRWDGLTAEERRRAAFSGAVNAPDRGGTPPAAPPRESARETPADAPAGRAR